jgi:hypothetical protein
MSMGPGAFNIPLWSSRNPHHKLRTSLEATTAEIARRYCERVEIFEQARSTTPITITT